MFTSSAGTEIIWLYVIIVVIKNSFAFLHVETMYFDKYGYAWEPNGTNWDVSEVTKLFLKFVPRQICWFNLKGNRLFVFFWFSQVSMTDFWWCLMELKSDKNNVYWQNGPLLMSLIVEEVAIFCGFSCARIESVFNTS